MSYRCALATFPQERNVPRGTFHEIVSPSVPRGTLLEILCCVPRGTFSRRWRRRPRIGYVSHFGYGWCQTGIRSSSEGQIFHAVLPTCYCIGSTWPRYL